MRDHQHLAIAVRGMDSDQRALHPLGDRGARLATRWGDQSRVARPGVEALAVCTQASLMKRYADAAAAEAFCVSRLDGFARTFGTLPARTDVAAIVKNAALEGQAQP